MEGELQTRVLEVAEHQAVRVKPPPASPQRAGGTRIPFTPPSAFLGGALVPADPLGGRGAPEEPAGGGLQQVSLARSTMPLLREAASRPDL